MTETIDSGHPSARILTDLLIAFGIRDIVISPGSRNTPVIIASDARVQLKKYVIVDERDAAFFALGRGLITQQPVALVCTSGTALLNYAPAVAEAYYRGVPLIVVSADRPMQWIDQDDSQTIRQPGVLANIVKKSYDIPVLTDDEPDISQKLWLTNRLINDALIEATSGRKGPVHINMQFDGRLGKLVDNPRLRSEEGSTERKIDIITPSPELNRDVIIELAREIINKKVLIIAGFMLPSDRTLRAVEKISRLPNVYVMAETISNLKLHHNNNAIDSLLSAANPDELDRLKPDIVITIGGALVSRMIKEYLRGIKNISHWSVGYQHTTVDCFTSLTKRIETEPRYFLTQLAAYAVKERRKRAEKLRNNGDKLINTGDKLQSTAEELTNIGKKVQSTTEELMNTGKKVQSTAEEMLNTGEKVQSNGEVLLNTEIDISPYSHYAQQWEMLKEKGLARLKRHVEEAPWSDLKAYSIIFDNITSKENLFLSNGSAIRYAQLLIGKLPHVCHCNRGVSGIDGTTATAIGGASAYKGDTILVTGDMSMFYDPGALSLPGGEGSMMIIIVNNTGGGIFRFIEATRSIPDREKYLSPSISVNTAALASAFNWEYFCADSEEKLKNYLNEMRRNMPHRAILEVKTGDGSPDLLRGLLNK